MIDTSTLIMLSLFLLIFVFLFVEYAVGSLDKKECEHTFAEYRSKNICICVDCGFVKKIKPSNY